MTRPRFGSQRLSRTFHGTFMPERQYLSAMLAHAASGRAGTMHEIADATGIPTGESTGKVQPTLDYCRGMGLIAVVGPTGSTAKRLELTALGRTVLLEDPFLKEPVTQWLVHLNLCSPLTGADVWYHTFMAGAQALGTCFTRETLQSYLAVACRASAPNLIGPLVRTYEDSAALGACGALSEEGRTIRRCPAPTEEQFARAYGAWLLQLIWDHFPEGSQVSLTELDARAGWCSIPRWDVGDARTALGLIERRGIVAVDRQMEPWLVRAAAGVDETWKRIYDDLM